MYGKLWDLVLRYRNLQRKIRAYAIRMKKANYANLGG